MSANEKSLIIIKPDAVHRGVVGEIINRFERKGLKMVAAKMIHLDDPTLDEHYSHHVGKPFFDEVKKFMKSAPSLFLVLEGLDCVEVVRRLAGETHGGKAAPGTIRGDFSLGIQSNVLHASDSIENAEAEIKRFFSEAEVFDYKRIDFEMLYSEDERKGE